MHKLLLLIGCLIAACSRDSGPDALPRVAAELVGVYHDWDAGRFAGLFAAPKHVETNGRSLAWMHEQLGECGEPTPMWSRGALQTRYSAACERGALELDITVDLAGRIDRLKFGAAGVAPGPALARAVQKAVAALPDGELTGPGNRSRARAFGRCGFVRTWVVSERAGLFHLQCEGGPAVLKLAIDEGGEAWLMNLWPGHVAGSLDAPV